MTELRSELRGLADTTRSVVDARLRKFFEDKRATTRALSPRSLELVNEIEELTMRGGKRLRPIVAAAAMVAVDGGAEPARIATLGASLELLQTFLLAHDDLMDGDLVRRGGPAMHAAFRRRHGDAVGDALGILGGDLASAYALELLLASPFASARMHEAVETMLRLSEEVYLGQHLDILGDADVRRMHDLKTGSYTVRGPARLGALLANADPEQLDALRAWAEPLGEAFQLADDVLGTFGDARTTGKPGDDLRHGKFNAVDLEARMRLGGAELERYLACFGRCDADDVELHKVLESLARRGVRDALSARIDACVRRSEDALSSAPMSPRGKTVLRGVGELLARRTV